MGQDDVGRQRNQLRGVAANLGGIGDRPAGVDPHVAADRPTQHRQSLQERPDAGQKYRIARRCGHEHTDPPHPLGLLRARRERPRRRTAKQRDEVATSHVPFAAYSHCFTEPVGRGRLRFRLTHPYSAAPQAYYFTYRRTAILAVQPA